MARWCLAGCSSERYRQPMTRTALWSWILLVAPSADAYDGTVRKKVFSMGAYTTSSGTTLATVKVGYETYGALNSRGDNAVLIAHFFSGTSHAAGKYAAADATLGYWDAIIGAGK